MAVMKVRIALHAAMANNGPQNETQEWRALVMHKSPTRHEKPETVNEVVSMIPTMPQPKRLDTRKLYWGGAMSQTINICIVSARISTTRFQSVFWVGVDRVDTMHTPNVDCSKASE